MSRSTGLAFSVAVLLLAGPLSSHGLAAKQPAKTTKKVLTKTTVRAKSTTPLKGKQLDTTSGRDRFCAGLIRARNDIINFEPDTASVQDAATQVARQSGNIMAGLSADAHLPILKWATLESLRNYFKIAQSLDALPSGSNAPVVLESTVQAIVDSGLDPFLLLHGYARTRCNFSMFIYGAATDLDAPPNAEQAELFGPVDAEALSIARKALPPAPKRGVWPRAHCYTVPSDADSAAVPSTVA